MLDFLIGFLSKVENKIKMSKEMKKHLLTKLLHLKQKLFLLSKSSNKFRLVRYWVCWNSLLLAIFARIIIWTLPVACMMSSHRKILLHELLPVYAVSIKWRTMWSNQGVIGLVSFLQNASFESPSQNSSLKNCAKFD